MTGNIFVLVARSLSGEVIEHIYASNTIDSLHQDLDFWYANIEPIKDEDLLPETIKIGPFILSKDKENKEYSDKYTSIPYHSNLAIIDIPLFDIDNT